MKWVDQLKYFTDCANTSFGGLAIVSDKKKSKMDSFMMLCFYCVCKCAYFITRPVLSQNPTCICMTESLPCSRETITTLLIGYTSVQNLKVQKKKKIYMSIFMVSCAFTRVDNVIPIITI